MLYSYGQFYIQSTVYHCTPRLAFPICHFLLYALQVPARGILEANPKACHWNPVYSPDRICFCCSVRVFALHFPQLDVSSAFASSRNQQVVPLIFSFVLLFSFSCLSSHALPRFCHLDFKRCQTKSTNNDLCRRPPSRMDPWTCVFYCSTCRRILDCLKYDGFQKIMMMIPWICMSSAFRCVTGLILYECCFMLHTLHIGFSPKDHLLLFFFWPWIPEASVPSPVQKVGYILSSTLKIAMTYLLDRFPFGLWV